MQMKIDPQWEVTPADVKEMLDRKDDFLLLDVRRLGEWDTARIDGAVLIPLQELGQRAEEIVDAKSRKIITLCHHGVRSLKAAAILRARGFADVKSMAGGIEAYSLLVDPRVPRY